MFSNQQSSKYKTRDSNLELFRIIIMLLIVAHHYVVNSGLIDCINSNPASNQSIFLLLFGAWGKVGINCFVLITGYFMCKSHITITKFLKLYFEVVFYALIGYLIFIIIGYEKFNLLNFIQKLVPFAELKDNFSGCFLIFYLFIPFLNILINNINKHQFKLLLALILIPYSLFGSIPKLSVRMNYVEWFCIIYFIGSYLRLYLPRYFDNKNYRIIFFFSNILLSILSIILINRLNKFQYFFLIDSNKILAVTLSISAFIYFKYLNIKYNKLINLIASTTFGVLLIHSSGNYMRKWLWKDFLNNIGQYGTSNLYIHAFLSVIGIFVICSLIDLIRIKLLEQPLFRLIENKIEKVEKKSKFNMIKSYF